jgi:hypothetical protein
VERKRHRDDEHLDPGHDVAHHGKGTADGLASGENRPNSGRRDLKLNGYHIFRFGATELRDPGSRPQPASGILHGPVQPVLA